MDIKTIKKAFIDNKVDLTKDDYWKVQSTYVIYHKAIERLGAAIKIRWDDISIVRAEKDECVLLVKASLPDGTQEWSFGEASIGVNYKVSGKQAAYVYAMAEKRAKDRVILKLAGLHGVYSEEEAEDFSRRNKTSGDEIYDEQDNSTVAESQDGGRLIASDDALEVEDKGESKPPVDVPAKGNVVPMRGRAKAETPHDPETGEVQGFDAEMTQFEAIKAKIAGFTKLGDVGNYFRGADGKAEMSRLSKQSQSALVELGHVRARELGWKPDEKKA